MADTADAPEQWEYAVLTLRAEAALQQDYFEEAFPGQKIRQYDVRSLNPQLDELGKDGWELISLVPVEEGIKGDMLIAGSPTGINSLGGGLWSHTYLCVFKRRVRE